MSEEITEQFPELYTLDYFHINTGNSMLPTATVRLIYKGKHFEDASCGDGPIDAGFKAIERITGTNVVLVDYNIRAITRGKDALGEATVKIKDNGNIFSGRNISTDTIEASLRAYLQAIDKLIFLKNKK